MHVKKRTIKSTKIIIITLVIYILLSLYTQVFAVPAPPTEAIIKSDFKVFYPKIAFMRHHKFNNFCYRKGKNRGKNQVNKSITRTKLNFNFFTINGLSHIN